MSLIIFSHANSFPASTYSVMFRSLRARGFSVRALEKLGHDPRYPVTSNWPHLVQELADFAAPNIAQHGQGAWLVGHSLGGFLSLMCAAHHPRLGGHAVRGVLLIDAPIISGWRARGLQLIKHTHLVGSILPGRISRGRRNTWDDAASALAHFQPKRAFASWAPQVLQDYIELATHDADTPQGTRRVLSFDRGIETAIYNTLPHNLDRLLRRHPLPCPVGFLGGTRSQEMKQVGMRMTRKLVGAGHPERLHMIDGSHLFPMEHPEATAAAIERVLSAMKP